MNFRILKQNLRLGNNTQYGTTNKPTAKSK